MVVDTNSANKTLCAVYDLGLFPTSFDLAPFLLLAQGEALEHGYEHIRLLLVDGEHHGVRFEGDEYEGLYPPAMRFWKVGHILQTLPRLCPLVERTVSIIPRAELHLYEDLYPRLTVADNYNEIYLRAWGQLHRYREDIGFRSSSAAHHYLQKWLAREMPSGDKRIVCMTLRESRWSTGRNTSVGVLAAAAKRLREEGYWPVVVPDTEKAFDRRGGEWSGISFCAPAAFDLELRMALYERAHLNLFTNSGPALLAIGSQSCRYIYLDIAHEDTSEAASDKIRELGMIPGLMPFRPGPYQRWAWEPLSVDLVLNAVSAMTEAIDRGIAPEDTGYPYFAVPFDEDNYLEKNPDVVSAIGLGKFCSALEHYARVGMFHGLSPISNDTEQHRQLASTTQKRDKDSCPQIDDQPGFDESYYLNLYPDVAKALIRGQFHSGQQHYLAFGRHEGRFMPPIPPESIDRPADGSDMLLAYYDITTYPESFDFCLFLMAAEVWRKRLGAGGIQVLIMAAAEEGWKYRNLSPEVWRQYLDTNTWWRIQQIVVPVANMLQTVREVRVSTDRPGCENFWETARYRYPVQKVLHDVPIYQAYRDALTELYRGGIDHLLEAPSSAHEYVDQMLKKWGTNDKRLIVITLREAIFAVERNSNMPAWLALAEELHKAGYGVVIIPDTDAILTGKSLLENCPFPVSMLASFNLYIRLALATRISESFPQRWLRHVGHLGGQDTLPDVF